MRLSRIRAYKRKVMMKSSSTEIECLLNSLDYALHNDGSLDERQRMMVLKKLVDMNKERCYKRTLRLQNELTVSEEVGDKVTHILW